jgi:hypothetical protein
MPGRFAQKMLIHPIDFINGGKYLARVSISTTTQSSKQEIKQS